MYLDLIRLIEDGDGSAEELQAATETLLRSCEEVALDSAPVRTFLLSVLDKLHETGYVWNGTTLRVGT